MSLEAAWREAKKAQSDLRMNEEFLNTVIDNIPAMIFIKDATELRFVRLNKTGAELLGYPASDFIGKNDFDFFPASEAKSFTDTDRNVLAKGILVEIPEEPIQTKTQDKKILHTRKIPIFDQQGHPLYLLGISEDITEQIAAKEEKEHLGKLLQQAQKLETIGKMAAGVAHDLNNILSGIINYPELLLLNIPADSPLKKPLENIRESGKRAANVVADLLTIARGVAAVKEKTNLTHLVEEYLRSPEHLNLLASSPRVTCTVELNPNLWTVFCTPGHIRKCLMNLINNAAEAFDSDNGGEIVISARNEKLRQIIPGFPDIKLGKYVILSVRDNGKGIILSDIVHIFEPFYTKKAMGRSGTGLGLTVVWNTIKDHQGAVTVESISGKGTTFSLYIPAVEGEATFQEENALIGDLSGHGETILIVDDEPHQRDIALTILQYLNYTVWTVSSGEEAIEYLKTNTVKLVILSDVRLRICNRNRSKKTT